MKTLSFEQMENVNGGFFPDPQCGDFVPDPRPECDGSWFPFPPPFFIIAFPSLSVIF
jgi:hypothetical protein